MSTYRTTERRQLVKGYVLPALRSELADASERTGRSESRLIEEALRSHLAWLRSTEGQAVQHGR